MLESGAARAPNVQGDSGYAGGNQVFIVHRHSWRFVCYNAGRLEDWDRTNVWWTPAQGKSKFLKRQWCPLEIIESEAKTLRMSFQTSKTKSHFCGHRCNKFQALDKSGRLHIVTASRVTVVITSPPHHGMAWHPLSPKNLKSLTILSARNPK